MMSIPKPVVIILIAVIAAFTFYLAFEYVKFKKLDGLREKAYALILIAEHSFLHGDNRAKLQFVVNHVHECLPEWLRYFITTETLMKIVDIWFKEVKDLLDDGRVNGSQDTEDTSQDTEDSEDEREAEY